MDSLLRFFDTSPWLSFVLIVCVFIVLMQLAASFGQLFRIIRIHHHHHSQRCREKHEIGPCPPES